MKETLLVGNPTAQSGKNKERIERALGLLRSGGLRAELFATLPAGETIPRVRDLLNSGKYDRVVAMGGDGTFREVGAALYASAHRESIAMGMLPTGTANDQGKSFGLQATEEALSRNVDVVVAGNETRLDAGVVRSLGASNDVISETVFFDSMGWGLSPRVLAQRNVDREIVAGLGLLKEIYRDQMVYAGAFVKTFLESYVESDKFTAVIVADGVSHELRGLTDLVVKATRVYAGAWVFDRESRHDDGLFEVVPFIGKLDWASKAIVALDGNPVTDADLAQIGVEHSKLFRGANISIALAPEGNIQVYAQMDGEEFPSAARFEIVVAKGAIRLIVP